MAFKKRKQLRVCESFTGSIVNAPASVVKVLSQAYASELVAYEFYTRYIGFLSGRQVQATESLLQELAWDELHHHAQRVKHRIAVFGKDHGVTLANVTAINPIPEVTSPSIALNYLTATAWLEKKTVEFYKKAVKIALDADDQVTADLLTEILADEEQHLAAASRLACQLVADGFTTPTVIVTTCPVVTVFSLNEGVANISCFFNYADGSIEYTDDCYASCDEVANALATLKQATTCSDYSEVCREVKACNSCSLPSENLTVTFGNGCAQITSDNLCKECSLEEVHDSLMKVFRNREKADSLRQILDAMQDHTVNGKTMKVQKFNNGEEANKFLEQNKGFTPVDSDSSGVYVALEAQTK